MLFSLEISILMTLVAVLVILVSVAVIVGIQATELAVCHADKPRKVKN
jgi:hypothetical protein